MDYEKKYKEALERAKAIYYQGSYKPDTAATISETLQNVFPELKESEDERIRKGLLYVIEHHPTLPTEEAEEYIAWLEKKGEQKTTIIIPKFRVGDEIKTSNEESLTITKIDEKGYWSEDLFICNFDDADKWELVEQKPWSEEDELCLTETLYLIRNSYSVDDKVERLSNWVKSLKDRYTWKPSDKQMEALRIAIGDEQGSDCCDILRSLLKDLKSL